jgi:L-fucose isomerase-like protein
LKKLVVGFVSAVQPSFWGSSKNEYSERFIPELEKLSKKMGFELFAVKEVMTNKLTAVSAVETLKNAGCDFIMVMLSTFAGGDIVDPLADSKIPLGIWGVPEITSNGPIPLNSFCGLNMFGSIIRQYNGRDIKYKWFYGDVTDEMFLRRFSVTIKALTAIKTLRNDSVALVGGIAPGFNDLYFDERKTKAKLGVKVERLYEYEDIKLKAISYTDDQIKPIIMQLKEESAGVSTFISEESLDKTARVYKAFEDFFVNNGHAAVAISCWPKYRRDFGIVVCAIISRLLENGYISACEGDIDSAISMLLLHYLTDEIPMLMDLSKVDLSDDTVLMWHCGSAPKRYSDKNGMFLKPHYKPGNRAPGEDNVLVGSVSDMFFKPVEVTIARFTDEYERMFILTGKFLDKSDRSYDGSRGWLGEFKLNGEPIALKDLMNTILANGLQHHYPIIFGNVYEELMETMAWMDIKPVTKVTYQNYLQ